MIEIRHAPSGRPGTRTPRRGAARTDPGRPHPSAWPTRARGVLAPLAVLAHFALTPAPADAQVKPSERATVSQTVDGTVLSLDYARPRARGRTELFGGVVDWGDVWTPGANESTVFETNRDVTIEGHEVPAGRWSVWMVVRDEGPWEMFLDPRDDLWHTADPEEADDQVRFPVEVERVEPVETLLWYFPEVRADGATLVFTWGRVRIPLEVEVEPTYRYTLPAEDARLFEGSWTMERARGGSEDGVTSVEIVHGDDGSLRAVGRSDERGDDSFEWVLLPKAEGVFSIGRTRNGELFSTTDAFLEMAYEEGRPASFTVRGGNDRVRWRGRRVR